MSMAIGTVSAIWRYRVSALIGEALDRVAVLETGLEGDRSHSLFEVESGQIAYPSILKRWNIAPQVAARSGASGDIEISLDGRHWRSSDDPALLDDLAGFFGVRVELKCYGSRVANGIATQRYAWQPIHLLSLQALDALRQLLPDSEIDAKRFRPNIVVDLPAVTGGLPEYSLVGREFSVGALRLRGIVPTGRCSFTTLAQQGLPEDRAVLRALIKDFQKNFGIYCEVLEPAEIAVGDSVVGNVAAVSQRPIVIVGAGQAGAMTAKALRELGSVQPIQIFGDERHAPYERPPLSKGGADGKAPDEALSHVLSAEQIEDLDLDLHLNSRVTAVHRQSREIETQDGGRHPYAKLVLATGGTARRLRGIERGHGRVHVVRTAEDASALRRLLRPGIRVCVLGGGWLGLEIAAAARQRRCEVTLFARQVRLLARMIPVAVADFVAARHRAEGVTLRLGEMPMLRERHEYVEVATSAGTERADLLVLAIGISPNDHLARMAGLEAGEGVLTDAAGATSDPDIFAVGDVARQRRPGHPNGIRVESWQNANDQPYALARALLSLPPAPLPPTMFWSTQYDMTLQIAGLPEPDATPLSHEGGDAPFWDFGSFAIGVNRPRDIHRFAAKLAAEQAHASSEPPTPSKEPELERVGPADGMPIGSIEDFPEGEIRRIEVDPLGALAIIRQNRQFFAVNDRCPHAEAALSEGFTERGRIVCPVHFAEFDLSTGQPYNAPPGCGRVACYRIERRADKLFLLF